MSVNVRGMFLCRFPLSSLPYFKIGGHICSSLTNLIGAYPTGYQYAASQMIKQGRGGRIIGASSLVGKQGSPSATAYSTSKFAIRGLTQSVGKFRKLLKNAQN